MVAALDRLTGGLLLAATGGGSELAVSLFDAKGELAKLSHELVGGLTDRMRGLSRFDRTERLNAAFHVLFFAAFFEAVTEADLPPAIKDLKLSRADQLALAGGQGGGSVGLADLVEGFTGSQYRTDILPIPGYGLGRRRWSTRYEIIAADLLRFIEGLEIWDRLDETARDRLAIVLRTEVTNAAVRRFDEHFRQLATDFPEVAFWMDRADHEATRDEVRRLATGFAGLHAALERMAIGREPDDRRTGLARHYRRQMERPVANTGDLPEGLQVPTLADAYVNPGYQLRPGDHGLNDESIWQGRRQMPDLQLFLLGYLTMPRATEVPLLVLGQPGSGKSVLTQVLAARLPASDFMAVRVVLRETPADTDLQSQIEFAVRAATGENIPWPELSRTTGDALPVVILDGFDELLQATGVSQSDYLERIVDFQEREAGQGRPVAVIVTSRTAVANRARIPARGLWIVRLEPFTDAQTEKWLDIWNRTNISELGRRGLRPIPLETVLRYRDLASQPLLLMMLAIYDADGNDLQCDAGSLDLAQLYERLLTRFAEREVAKSRGGLDRREFTEAVEHELLRLSIAALAMFNRGRQWVTEDELSTDLAALTPEELSVSDAGFRAPLTRGQRLIGRFFFVHQARAVRHESQLSTYEFLHATFGEFLVARLTCQAMNELVALARLGTGRMRRQPVDDGFLRTLISFAPLCAREPVMDFLEQQIGRIENDDRRLLGDQLLTLFQGSLDARLDAATYAPNSVPVTGRYAAYSVNLLLLTTLVRGELTGAELFPQAESPVRAWRRHAQFWHSQFSDDGWTGLIELLRLDRTWTGDGEREIRLMVDRSWRPVLNVDLEWVMGAQRDPRSAYVRFSELELVRIAGSFLCDVTQDTLFHSLEALEDIGVDSATFSHRPNGGLVSITRALHELWIQSGRPDVEVDALIRAYELCIDILQFVPAEAAPSALNLVLRQLAADSRRLPRDWRISTLHRFERIIHLKPQLRYWGSEAFQDLGVDFS
ncbi:NACHT domain-containing protein [Spirillospora sp. CA-294931]|uniref:NACHT domain-containing protein n=1 Tax=Spirillospora sp. CA-294931 TaxID=3240042 RepID=UPI003D8EAE3C